MILKNISIINFKNIKSANLELSPKINCLIGHNGMGKTNFLDAIYYLSFCRSAYNSIDSQIITHDEPFFMLEGNYDMRKMVEQRTKGTVEFKTEVNPELIGGFILEYDTYRMDASVKTKLNNILTQLKK